ARAEVEQVAALEADVARVAVDRVVLEVELHERIYAVQAGDVVAEVETAPQKLAALIVYAEGVTRGVHDAQAVEAADARVPRQAEVGIDREVARVLKHLRGPGGNFEDQSGRHDGGGQGKERPRRADVEFGEARVGAEFADFIVRLHPHPAELVNHDGEPGRDGQACLGAGEDIIAAAEDVVRTRRL